MIEKPRDKIVDKKSWFIKRISKEKEQKNYKMIQEL